jgi:hypothetical protein
MIAQPIFNNQTSSSQSWVSTPLPHLPSVEAATATSITCTPDRFPQPRLFSSLLYHQSIIQLLNNYGLVSPDAAIAIVFGLVGASISFAGVAIACLTLRFMMSALPPLHYQLESTFCSSAYVDRVLKQMSDVSEYMVIVRFSDMSTCISSHYLRVKD